ncbi:hypothetical protein C8J57DRAFT_1261575 [Mycena rebaudengoi]|nr:hypothetical protein C8J57DRAFT_1261575 [Mycena rebaudengoi]
MLLETLDSPDDKHSKKSGVSNARATRKQRNTKGAVNVSFADTNSTTPCPVFCEGCGTQDPDGDDDPEKVQCEKCRLWAHIGCLATDVDWNDPDVEFICKRCRVDPLIDMFRPNQVILVPSPHVPNWKAPGVLWYPAKFIERHQGRAGKKEEYEFRWLECTDGETFNSATSDVPLMMQRTFFKARKFCQAIDEVKLAEKQMGKIRMPRYMDPSFKHHENPTLAIIFDTAIPAVSKILAKFDVNHPVVRNFNTYFNSTKENAKDKQKTKPSLGRDIPQWMRSCGLAIMPELEAILEPALQKLLNHHDLAHLRKEERTERVLGVSSVLLQLLDAQQQLNEPLNINGDLLGDLLDGRVVYCFNDGDAGISAMFAFVSGAGFEAAYRLLKFKSEHVIWDANFRPPTFRRDDASRFAATSPIPVVIKRKGAQEIEGESPSKRAREVQANEVQ